MELFNRFRNTIFLKEDSDLKKQLNELKNIRDKYDVLPIWIPRSYGAKDISDFHLLYGRDKTFELIDEAKRCI